VAGPRVITPPILPPSFRMKTKRAPQPAALVVKWPQGVSEFIARGIARRLSASQTPATWAVDQASQLKSLASWNAGGIDEAALIVPAPADRSATGPATPATEIARRLDLLRGTGAAVDLVHAAGDLTQGHWPRTLRALAVHGVVVDGAPADGSARALPFGVWQFTPQAIVPHVRGWFAWLSRRRPVFVGGSNLPAVATLDLSRVAGDKRAQHEVEQAMEQAAEAARSGAIRLLTMGELTARYTSASASRPQRSILRAA
jgi:hypothetical protein